MATSEETLRRAAVRVERAYAAFHAADSEDQQGAAYERLRDAMLNLRHVLQTGKTYRPPQRRQSTVSIYDAIKDSGIR